MSWEPIERIAPAKTPAASLCPLWGVQVRLRRGGGARGGSSAHIRLKIGMRLARQLDLTADRAPIALLRGQGDSAGMLAVRPDAAGAFHARRLATGEYWMAINRRSALDLFNFDFADFTVERADLIAPDAVPMAVFRAGPGMLMGESE